MDQETLVTAATGVLGPVIAKLAALLGSEYKLRWRTRRDVNFIRSKLKTLHSLLWNTWEKEDLDAASKALKREALDLADDMEDAIDDFILSMERSNNNMRFIQTKMKVSPFKDLKKRASEVSGRCRSKWKKNRLSSLLSEKLATDSSPGKRRAYPFDRKDASELVGMDGQLNKLVEHLVGKYESTPVQLQLKTASIVGTAGMGKTALAHLVYDKIEERFQARAFVTLTPGGSIKEVLARFLQQVQAHSDVPLTGTKAYTEEHLIHIISNFLKDKRYLVIIDDIWNWREWEIIKKSLPENNLGSRVVRTTRMKDMGQKWRGDGSNSLVHDMLPKCKIIYNKCVYVNDEDNIATWMIARKADFVADGFNSEHPIVHMCGGTPLAVLCMLSAVAQEKEKQAQKGLQGSSCDVQDTIEKHVNKNGIQNTPGYEPLVESLQLGYDDLPHHMLKTCLLYCSIYPEGHTFERDELVKRWLSEGFVYKEEEANGYFEELVNRGLFLRGGMFKDFRMHPMLRNFLRYKSRHDGFTTCSSEITSSYKFRIRRLCIYNSPRGDAVDEDDPLSVLDWRHIRSLAVYGGIERVPFEKLEGLRVLDLCMRKRVVDHHLKDICGLVRLRHLLGLDGDGISKTPPEIVRLQCLETFQVRGSGFARLPGFIGYLQQLKTLEMRGREIKELPMEIGGLQQLETLRIRGTGIIKLPREIGGLQQLKNLVMKKASIRELPKEIGILWRLKTLDMRSTSITVLPKEIGSLQQLEYLNMSKSSIRELPKEIGMLKQLKTLDMRSTSITVLPKEIGGLQQLEYFDMSSSSIQELPEEIGSLKQLKTLDMRSTSITVLPKEIGSLQQLQYLYMCSSSLSELPKEIGSLQQLKTLDMGSTWITVLPKEIGSLQQLEYLDITATRITVLAKEIGKLQRLEHLLMSYSRVAKIPKEIGALKELKTLELPSGIVAIPFELCQVSALVKLPMWIHHALNKSSLESELAGEMLSFQTSGGLIVGAKQMRIPSWIKEHFNYLAKLDIRICKLEEEGLKILREISGLEKLTLRFEVVPREPIVISSEGFKALETLTVDSRVPRVSFQEGAMPMLESLTFEFQFYAGPPNKDPVGINHLSRLTRIEFKCNTNWYQGESPCIGSTIDVVRKEAEELPGDIVLVVSGRNLEFLRGDSSTEGSNAYSDFEIEEKTIRLPESPPPPSSPPPCNGRDREGDLKPEMEQGCSSSRRQVKRIRRRFKSRRTPKIN